MFIDFEASSLAPDSWPIEVGLSWIDGGSVHTWSCLIRPHRTWSEAGWSPDSASVHGIKRADLEAAPEAQEVAQEVRHWIGRRKVVSDAPTFDGIWMDRLAQTIGSTRLRLHDLHELASRTFSGSSLDWFYEGLEKRKAPHRAGPDSRRLAAAWQDASGGCGWGRAVS